jgi:hypothetical protein
MHVHLGASIMDAMPSSSFKTPQVMAQAVLDHIVRLQLPRPTPRPWSRHEPERTMWWLVPSTDWPAYWHGKFAFRHGRDEPNRIFAGLHVEKGLGASASPGLTRSETTLVTTSHWLWEQFLGDLASSSFGSALGLVSARSGADATLLIKAAHFYPGFDPQGIHERDEVLFRANGNSLQCESQTILVGLLTSVASSRSSAELEAALKQVPQADWAWIDVFAGVLLDVPSEDGDEAWGARQIWENVLEPLRPWFR